MAPEVSQRSKQRGRDVGQVLKVSLPFSFQFFTRLTAVCVEEVGGVPLLLQLGPI